MKFVCQRGMALTDITRIQGVEIFADSLEWFNWDRSKRIFQVDVWNIKTPMVDILGDGENFRKLGEEFSKNS